MRRPNGFTLLELITCLAIIGVIALCAVPAFATYRRRASLNAEAAMFVGNSGPGAAWRPNS